MSAVILISLAGNAVLGLALLRRGVEFRKHEKYEAAEPADANTLSCSVNGSTTMKEIVDFCLPENNPSMSELEENS